jgi:hypothetical protein
MPVHYGKNKQGTFYQWGTSGKKYYYTTELGKKKAYNKAQKQGIAIYASGYKGK